MDREKKMMRHGWNENKRERKTQKERDIYIYRERE